MLPRQKRGREFELGICMTPVTFVLHIFVLALLLSLHLKWNTILIEVCTNLNAKCRQLRCEDKNSNINRKIHRGKASLELQVYNTINIVCCLLTRSLL